MLRVGSEYLDTPLLAVVVLLSLGFVGLAEGQDLTNLSHHIVSAAASSTAGDNQPPEAAFDGNLKTGWRSGEGSAEWLEAVFGGPVAMAQLTLYWGRPRPTGYTILAMDRKKKWIALLERSSVEGNIDELRFAAPIRVHGLRIQCGNSTGGHGCALNEMEVVGTASTPLPEHSVAEWMPTMPQQDDEPVRQQAGARMPAKAVDDDAFLDLIERRAFDFFWKETSVKTGLTKDRAHNFVAHAYTPHASVAASGYALTAFVIGAERGWVSRDEALQRTITTLSTFVEGRVRNVEGFYPHFVNFFTGEDAPGTEVSTVDTVLLMTGVITAMEYFRDLEVTRLARILYDRIDWNWARDGHDFFVSHGLDAEGAFLDAHWGSMTEGLLVYLLGLGSKRHRLPASTWKAIERVWGQYGDYRFLVEKGFQSMFRYQYPLLWYDLRGKKDRQSGVDFFENATLAALAMRTYCLEAMDRFPDSYGPNMWGLSACDGPGGAYRVYGFPPGRPGPRAARDGTVVVYAMAGSISLLPQHVIRGLRYIYDRHPEAWGRYGFSGSLNPERAFVARDVIGIDVGTIMIAIENYRSGLIWKTFMKNRWIKSTNDKVGWARYPHAGHAIGPVDLARDYRWKFKPGDGAFQSADIDDRSWREVVVPGYWEYIDPAYRNLNGVGWYRVHFNLPQQRLARWTIAPVPIVLTLGGIADGDTAYVNGVKVGETVAVSRADRGARRYKVAQGLLKPGTNVVAVRVQNVEGRGGIWSTPVTLGPAYQ